MAHVGLDLYVNGEATDTTVENDTAAWTAKAGKVTITGGGGSWWKNSQPAVCRFDAYIPLRYASRVDTVTVGVNGANDDRIVFHGTVNQARVTRDGFCQFDAVSEMSALLSRRARCAAAPDTGIRAVLTDIETAHGLSMTGNTRFHTNANYPNLDRPAQKGTSNGEYIRTALAGSGTNLAEQWSGTMASPVLEWRPDYYDAAGGGSTTGQTTIEVGYPWLWQYADVGYTWNDYVARVNLDGENAAGTEKYGWARLSDATIRTRLGNRDVNLNTWIDNTSDLELYARRLLARVGEPGYLRMLQLTASVEHHWRIFDEDGVLDPDDEATLMAGLHPGDTLTTRNAFGNSHASYRDWPTYMGPGSDGYDDVYALWNPTIGDDTVSGTVGHFVVRTVTRTWHPTEGWFITLGIDPDAYLSNALTGADIASYGSGNY